MIAAVPASWSGPLLLAALALPDILPPGHHAVDHKLVVTAGGVPADMRLVAAPARGLHGVHAVVAGEPFSFSRKYGTRLYLVPAAEPLPKFDAELFGRFAKSSTLPQIASAPLGSPLHRIVTTWRITSVDGNTIALERVAEEKFDAAGNPLPAGGEWIVLAAIALFGALWLIRLERQRTESLTALEATGG